jgi:hypothetical protein
MVARAIRLDGTAAEGGPVARADALLEALLSDPARVTTPSELARFDLGPCIFPASPEASRSSPRTAAG